VAGLGIESNVGALADEWEALAERCNASPFHRPGWVSAWWSAFGTSSLQIASLRRSGRLVGVLPLCRNQGALRSTTNWHTPLFGPLAEDRDDAQELLRGLFGLGVRSVELAFLDEADRVVAMQAARASGRRLVTRALFSAPYVLLDGDWDAYEAGLSSSRRKGIRRRRRAIESEGRLSFEVDRGRSGLDGLLGEAFSVETSGWKGARGTAIASCPDTREFYAAVARWAAAKGWLRLGFLRLDGRPLAVDIALEHAGTWYSLKSGYDEAYRRFAPGVLLLDAELRHCFSSGLARFELMGPADAFKLEWASGVAPQMWLQAFAPSPAGCAEGAWVMARERARPLVKRIRATRAS
jgi:CelD/BcsL family acetyltransferase involved in cellulose biosynthesis